jgi:LEM3 (ligand-effect modulator 3) family / CDC50 family
MILELTLQDNKENSYQRSLYDTTKRLSDIITVSGSSVAGVSMDEKMIAMEADKTKFKQVDGFSFQPIVDPLTKCSDVGLPENCKLYKDKSGDSYLYFYPDDDSVQYLYETYPRQITPLEGVTNEHFIVWMKTAALSKFRKLYGKIRQDFRKGDTLTFEVDANFEVRSFNGDKAIIISTLGPLGGKNVSLGISYIVAGCLGFFLAAVFVVKLYFNKRALGDSSLLVWPKELTL